MLNTEEIKNSLNYQLAKISKFKEIKEDKKADIEMVKSQILLKNGSIKTIEMAQVLYGKTLDIIYDRSVGELRDVLNNALAYIFYDRKYTINIDLSDKRGKSLSISVLNEDGLEESLKEGKGRGLLTVISFCLHSYYLIQQRSPYLFIDEGYSAVSVEYVGRFFEFIKKMCEEHSFRLVIITHDDRIMNFADATYKVNKGMVEKLEK